MSNRLRRLSEHLSVYQGEINVGVLSDGERCLLIDYGEGDVLQVLESTGARRGEVVLLTHHHRDQVAGLVSAAAGKVGVLVPAAERALFDQVEQYWRDSSHGWHLYDGLARQLVLSEPITVDGECQPDDSLAWGEARVTALAIPGHTDGSLSLSYQVDVDGQRVVFSGDVIYDAGQVWDLFSLQGDGPKLDDGDILSDYHGYMGRRHQLLASLRRLRAAEPDVLVPSHGNIMRSPCPAIDDLILRLVEHYRQCSAVSALRYYYPEVFETATDSTCRMAPAETSAPPPFLRKFDTTWVLVSESGAAFVLDCGFASAVGAIEDLLARGEISGVEGLWITHYHDDHVDACEPFLKQFCCPVYADESVAEVIQAPLSHHLLCISPQAVPVDHSTSDGQSWLWQEFSITGYHFPGQTIHHGGLLIEGQGQRLFFAGDSFTPSGMDDYCMANRNPLGAGMGFERCIEMLRRLQPDAIFNQHVSEGFRFNEEQYEYMIANLQARRRTCLQLVPWDEPDNGLDPYWVRCAPYEQQARAGMLSVDVVATHYSSSPNQLSATLRLPSKSSSTSEPISSATVPPRDEASLSVVFSVPKQAAAGRHVLPGSITYTGCRLGQVVESIAVVE